MPRIRSLRGSVYTAAERAELILRFSTQWGRADAAEEAEDVDAAQASRTQALAIAADYAAATPIVSLSRSPFTGEVFESSLDTIGLDGMWWAYDFDFRPFVEPVPSYFAWTGAMQLDGPLPNLPLKAMVGPEVPFVLPRILDHPALRAVVSSVLVGEHVGYPIVYFADPVPRGLERVNDWGHSTHAVQRADGSPTTASAVEHDLDKDFDLGPWLEAGKLQWIRPGDIDLELRSGTAGCPFVDLPGHRNRQYIQRGRHWFAREVQH